MTKQANQLSVLDYSTQETVDTTIIWLHGLGANGCDFMPIIDRLPLCHTHAIRFLFPNAPHIPVTINQGQIMPAWYDIYALTLDSKIDTTGILQSADAIQQIMLKEIERGIASEKIILVGFSQGGAIALEAGLSFCHKLAGILALSSYFPSYQTLNGHPANLTTPIRLDHGEFDPIITQPMAEHTTKALITRGYNVNCHHYSMGHEICSQQITDLSLWFSDRLSHCSS